MNYVIILIGVIYAAMAAMIIVKPQLCYDFINGLLDYLAFQIAIGIYGLVLGGIFLLSADVTKFPTLFIVVGLFSMAGACIAVFPRSDFKRLVAWELDLLSYFPRVFGFITVLIGGFLIYAGM